MSDELKARQLIKATLYEIGLIKDPGDLCPKITFATLDLWRIRLNAVLDLLRREDGSSVVRPGLWSELEALREDLLDLVCDEDLTDEKLQEAAEGPIPLVCDALGELLRYPIQREEPEPKAIGVLHPDGPRCLEEGNVVDVYPMHLAGPSDVLVYTSPPAESKPMAMVGKVRSLVQEIKSARDPHEEEAAIQHLESLYTLPAESRPVAWGDRDLLERLVRDGYAEVQTERSATEEPSVAVYTSPPAVERDHRAMEKLRAAHRKRPVRWAFRRGTLGCWAPPWDKQYGTHDDPADAILAEEGEGE